jgi:N-acetylmuramoyl-L-alanine amidase
MTREADRFIPLQDRPEFANNQGADLFLSIHVNAHKNPKVSGIETYYLALASDASASETAARENVGASYSIQELDLLVSKILHESKSEESQRLAECVQSELIYTTGLVNRGVKHAPFVVLIGTKVPAILIEIGFLSNEIEAKQLITVEYQQKLAAAIVSGVEDYVANVPKITKKK